LNISYTPPLPKSKSKKPKINEALYKTSLRFRLAKFISLVMFAVFVIIMVAANREELTLENIRYLMRYLDADANIYSYTSDYKTISYSADSEIAFGVYRGDFVVADSNSLNIYASSGSSVQQSSSFIANPVLLPSNKHLLVYDLGGNSFSVYNTFSRINNGSLDYPITGGVNSDSGMFALISKTSEYRSAVFVFDEAGKKVSQILKNKLIMAIDLSRDGKRLLIASAYNDPQSGDFLTEIMICDPLTGEEIVNTTLYDTMPLKAQFSKTGFYLLTDKYLLFCDNSAVTRSRYDFEFNYPTHVTMTSDALFAAFSESVLGDTQKVLIFSDKGNEMGQYIADGKIVRLIHDSNDVYTLTDSNIQRYDIASGRSIKYKVDSNIVDMILARSDTLYLCYLSHANAIVTNDALSFDKNENDIVNAK